MISFQNVSKIYHSSSEEPIVALQDISFQVKEGEFVSIAGRSGAGKTTLIRLLIGEEKPTQGEIFFKGKNIHQNQKDLQKLRRKIGVVHQDYKLLPLKTVTENVAYVMQVIGASDRDIQRDIPQILDIVGLTERVANLPKELSGGEKQRLAIARALCHRPEVIVADEPTGNLDLYNTFEIINLFKKIHRLGTTIILAAHNKEVIDGLGRRVITLEEGRVIRDDPQGKFIL